MTLSVCKNVRILIFGVTGSAANVLRAPGPTIIRAPSNETMGLRVPRKKILGLRVPVTSSLGPWGLVEFQFKPLHRRISTNDFLTKTGIKDDPNCSFSNEELEQLSNLFWSCSKVTTFWDYLIQRLTLSQIIPQNYKINIDTRRR